ncbi:MAG: Inosine/uridine-preferring nucleoside hydrolase [Candidatus Gottesmanbacteria bacterium GW2011_GWA1_44_24b]|uniref:Inosine/uridine-preferring nucleoside hydrolase n=1 Tax=Candidatus Gottesmanbacteria bacterium GW2011_GWA1_44_24b TaxID=1618437 RepID=A0A0G1KSG6_9BACT|nr:MAG: Inosine/uridine-preferring nucleoside hydrolase [Candidatus Gottesmanbacteria bacterium GW2011_GWA1_44_24b]HCM81997.1 hypothetical protein [Patescibacteria group bacterium]
MNTNILIDTDAGMDDIVAILMLMAKLSNRIIGISTVFGLVNPDTGARNLLKILDYVSIKKEICVGSLRALSRISWNDSFPAQDCINSTQLTFLRSALSVSSMTVPTTIPIEKWYGQKVLNSSRRTTIFCLGPLTNIAKVINKYGMAFEKKIAQLIIMGGAVQTKGNVGPDFVSEYNFFLDPKAASIVCSSSIPIKLVSLDGCRQLAFDKTQSLKIPDNPYGIIIKKIIKNNQNDFQYFYDPLAASVIINPSIASFTKRQSCTVIQKGKNRGKIVQADNPIKNIRVINKVNTMLFYSLLNSIMKRELLKF